MNNIDKLSIAAIRSTCIDMIHAANSGHPGMALGSAPILYTLFKNHLQHFDAWASTFVTLMIQLGLIEIDLFYLQVTQAHYFIQCYIYVIIA